ncbi:MAG: hypothetical protein ACREA3_01220 [Nitrosotalea sp.]
MTKNRFQDTLIGFVDWISKYSLVYYIIITFVLFVVQLDVFKDNVPTKNITNLLVALLIFTISSSMLDKILKKKIKDSKPFLYCPECVDAKMKTSGTWICEKCHKEFGQPRKENTQTP